MSLNNQLNIAKLFAEANNEPMEEGTVLEKTTADNLPDVCCLFVSYMFIINISGNSKISKN